MEQIVKAAEDLKAAADVLIEAVSSLGPAVMPPDPETMSDEQRQRWREFVNVIAETAFSQRLTSIGEQITELEKKMPRLVEDAVSEAAADMGYWNELDPHEVEEAVDFSQRAPDPSTIEEGLESIDEIKSKVEEIEGKIEGVKDADDLETDLEDLKHRLAPILSMLQAVEAAARPRPEAVSSQ